MVDVIIFEDETRRNLLPLTYTKPAFELLCGGRRQRDRVFGAFGRENTAVLVREYLRETLRDRLDVEVNEIGRQRNYLMVNGALLASEEELKELDKSLDTGKAVFDDDVLIAVKAKREIAERIAEKAVLGGKNISELARRYAAARMGKSLRILRFPWNLIEYNPAMIEKDLREVKGSFRRRIESNVGKNPLFLGKGVDIEENSYIDTRDGPIVIEDEVEVQFPSRISGPTWIGRNSLLSSALIRGGTTIGEVCKVGGEVEQSVMEGYSNKAHDSYLGHSYVGQWVNVGAFSVTSNLKNTYGTVRVDVKGESRDSKMLKLGVFLADCSKVSISTAIYAGKKIGVSSHIHGVITEDVPSFTLWAASLGGRTVELRLSSAIETLERMASRRGVKVTGAEKKLLEKIFELTEGERMRIGVKKEEFTLPL